MRSALFALLALAACANEPAGADSTAIEALYPEGPLWQGDRLYFAEMSADRVSVFEDGAAHPFFTQEGCGPTAIAPYGEGFLVLCHIGARVVAIDAAGHELRRWDRGPGDVRFMDPNDCSADGQGGVYFSDPGLFSRETRPHGRVWHLSADGTISMVAERLWYPNGVFVDVAHAKLYVGEHMSAHVMRYDIVGAGRVEGPDVFVDLSDVERPRRYAEPYAETGPDGMEIGPDGDMYIAVYGEGRILRFSLEGQFRGYLSEPARYLTNIAFGPGGQAVTTGSFDNIDPPFPGEVRFHPTGILTRTPE